MTTHPGPYSARTVALHMLARWMGERFFRTFRPGKGSPAPFDAVLQQRERRVGVSTGVLWDEAAEVPGATALSELLSADASSDPTILDGSYAVWAPPLVMLPVEEPAVSDLRTLLAAGLRHMDPNERREVRIPVTVKLAKIQADGAYVSVSGGMSTIWTQLSDGISGAFHLDSRSVRRLPEQPAELDIMVSHVRDRAAVLAPEELTDVAVHDYWVVTRLPETAVPGVTVIASPPDVDPLDSAGIRRRFRAAVQRAVDQKRDGDVDLTALVVVGPFAHMKDETVTAALRGMNPALYGALDLVAMVADGQVRQVLQPRTLPWEQDR